MKRLAAISAILTLLVPTLTSCTQTPAPTSAAGQAEQKQAAQARPKPEEKPDPDDPQITGLPRADYDGSGPSGIYKGIPPAPPDPADFPGMNEDTDAGAIQTLKYWDTALNYAIATGDVSYARKYNASECEDCTEYLDKVINKHKEGTYGKNRRIKHLDFEIKMEADNKVYYLYGESKGLVAVEKGKKPSPPSGEYDYVRAGIMRHTGSQWLITAMDYAVEPRK
ncbi:DUF6318 family protein [Dermabacteraceae bacterium P7074]